MPGRGRLSPRSARMKKSDIAFYTLLAAAAGMLLYQLAFVFFQTPVAQLGAGGLGQKIFYFHVPAAYAMYLSGTVCLAGSAAYLLKPTDLRDALGQAGAECASLFGLVMLTSGPLWAKTAWGIYWTWDPRLTMTLLTFLLYGAVVILRNFAGDGHAERKFAAALGVLGTVNLPIVHYAVRKWGGTHPAVITQGGDGLKHPAMVQALLMGFVAMSLVAAVLLWSRARLALTRARVSHVEELALSEGLLD